MVGGKRPINASKKRMLRTTCISFKTEIQGRIPAGEAGSFFLPSSQDVFVYGGVFAESAKQSLSCFYRSGRKPVC